MSSANVQAIHALDDLRAALTRFGSEAQSALDATQQEIQRTFDWVKVVILHSFHKGHEATPSFWIFS